MGFRKFQPSLESQWTLKYRFSFEWRRITWSKMFWDFVSCRLGGIVNKEKTPQFSKWFKLIAEMMMKLRRRSRRPGAIHLEIDAKQGAKVRFNHRNAEGENLPLLPCVKCVRPRDDGIEMEWVSRRRRSCEKPPGTCLLLVVVSLRQISEIYKSQKGSQFWRFAESQNF